MKKNNSLALRCEVKRPDLVVKIHSINKDLQGQRRNHMQDVQAQGQNWSTPVKQGRAASTQGLPGLCLTLARSGTAKKPPLLLEKAPAGAGVSGKGAHVHQCSATAAVAQHARQTSMQALGSAMPQLVRPRSPWNFFSAPLRFCSVCRRRDHESLAAWAVQCRAGVCAM